MRKQSTKKREGVIERTQEEGRTGTTTQFNNFLFAN